MPFHPLEKLFLQQAGQFLDTLGSTFADDVYVTRRVGIHRLGVDEVDLGAGGYVVEKAGGRINVHGSAYDDEDVSLLHIVDGGLYLGDSLTKPHDEGAQLAAIAGLVAQVDFVFLGLQFLM